MPTDNFRVQMTRGTTSQNDAYTGQPGELTLDLELGNVRLHDGLKAGGVNLTEPVGGILENDRTGLAAGESSRMDYLEGIYNPGIGFTFAPDVVDGDVVYIHAKDYTVNKAVPMDRSKFLTHTGNPDYVPDTNMEYVADVTNNRFYGIRLVDSVPKHIQDIMFAGLPEKEDLVLWCDPDNPGKLTTVDHLTSHGIDTNNRVYKSKHFGLVPWHTGRVPSGRISYTAQEGEDISLKLDFLLKLYAIVDLMVPFGVTCESTRVLVGVGDYSHLNVLVNGRLDLRSKTPQGQYLTSGPWYTCAGFEVRGVLNAYGNGSIHHHVPPGTKLYRQPSGVFTVPAYQTRTATINLMSHNLKFYLTICLFSHGLGGSKMKTFTGGIDIYMERLSPAISAYQRTLGAFDNPYMHGQGSWSFGGFYVEHNSSATASFNNIGVFAPVSNNGNYLNSGVGHNFNGMLIT